MNMNINGNIQIDMYRVNSKKQHVSSIKYECQLPSTLIGHRPVGPSLILWVAVS